MSVGIKMGTKRVILLLALVTTALAADGIEVLSQLDVKDGIEVLCRYDKGARIEAHRLVNGDWVKIDSTPLDASGLAAVLFPDLEADEARLVLLDATGEAVETLVYKGGTSWSAE